jgi:uncharacterized protein (DUF305 family)
MVVIPFDTDVVILKEAGIKHLITDQNFALMMDPTCQQAISISQSRAHQDSMLDLSAFYQSQRQESKPMVTDSATTGQKRKIVCISRLYK